MIDVTAEEYPVPPRVTGRGAVFVEHRLKIPQVAESAYIAPTAVLAGEVTVGPHSRVLFGAVLNQYFTRYVSINSMTETVLRSLSRGEINRWTSNWGRRPTL